MKKPCNNCLYSKESYSKKFGKEPNDVLRCSNCDKYMKYKIFRESQRKYKPGKTIKSISDFENHIDDGVVYFFDSIKPIAFLTHLQYVILKKYIENGRIKEAVRK